MILNSYKKALQQLKNQHFTSTKTLFEACKYFIFHQQQENVIQQLILSQFQNAFSRFHNHPQGKKILKRFFFILLEQYKY